MKFELNASKVKLVEENSKSQFMTVEIDVCRSGYNTHRMPISREAILASAHSVKGVPVLAEFVDNGNGIKGHGATEVAVGFAIDEEPTFKEVDDEIYLSVKAKIWKVYYPNLVKIFADKDGVLEVSMEANLLDGREPTRFMDGKIDLFSITGITLLSVQPSIKGSKATVLSFSEIKEQYNKEQFSVEDNNTVIDNSIEASVSGEWSNPRQKLFVPLSESFNSKELLSEAYCTVNFAEDSELSIKDVKYPHHIIKDDKLVVHIDGLKASFMSAISEDNVSEDVVNHLKNHYNLLGLNSDNFTDFGFNDIQFEKYFVENFRKEENDLDFSLTAEQKRDMLYSAVSEIYFEVVEGEKHCCVWIRDYDETYVYFRDYRDDKIYRAKYEQSSEMNAFVLDAESKEEVLGDYIPLSEIEMEAYNNFSQEYSKAVGSFKEEDEKAEEEEPETEEAKGEEEVEMEAEVPPENVENEFSYEEIYGKYTALMEENKLYAEKIEQMSDYEELKEFKRVAREKEDMAVEMAEMNKVMEKLAEKVKLSEETTAELYSKRSEFSSVDAWGNYAKAYAFDNCSIVENEDGIVRMATPIVEEPKTYTGLWGDIKK